MRRSEESQKSEFERDVKLGEDNAECLRQMRRWCKHVEIERVSGGLYAQITGLPIASHSLGCPKVEGSRQSMNLRWIFSDFLVQHCADCPHHASNGDTSWGQEIIDDHREEVQRREQAAKEEADRISRLRSDRHAHELTGARNELIDRGLIAFEQGVYQVLDLPPGPTETE